MKWEIPKLIDMSTQVASGDCINGSAPGASCKAGASASTFCDSGGGAAI